jgi:transcriptional regulator with XRE-family HTH domain
MPAKPARLYPGLAKLLIEFGERLRLARLRRHFSVETVCVRADIARATLYRAEKGDPAVTLGTYSRILQVLQLEADLNLLALDDTLGRKLQDLALPVRRRAPRKLAAKGPVGFTVTQPGNGS